MQNELAIWQRINATKTVGELKAVIIDVWGKDGVIPGRLDPWTVTEMLLFIDQFKEDFDDNLAANAIRYRSLPTRNFGIRQQLLFILINPRK